MNRKPGEKWTDTPTADIREKIRQTFEYPNRYFKAKIEVDGPHGVNYEETIGVVELWWKRSGYNQKGTWHKFRRAAMLETCEYSSREGRDKVLALWKRKYNTHLYDKFFFFMMKPYLKIDEDYVEENELAAYENT